MRWVYTHIVLCAEGRQISLLVLTEGGGDLWVADDLDNLVRLCTEGVPGREELLCPLRRVVDGGRHLVGSDPSCFPELTPDAVEVVDHVRPLEQAVPRPEHLLAGVHLALLEEVDEREGEVPVEVGQDEHGDVLGGRAAARARARRPVCHRAG